jgi:Mrp family chromosome partitioning ATPase/capsular polysaccharide biosynthesis protein
LAVEKRDSPDVTLRDYARVVWRRKWIVIGTTLLFLALALGYSFAKTPLYQASATLIYENQLDLSNPLSTGAYVDPTQRQIELSSVGSVITSPDLIKDARALMSRSGPIADYSVSAAPQATTGQGDASTVVITAVSPSAQTAASAANAYAAAFAALRKAQAQTQVRQAEQVVQSKLDSFESDVSRQSADYLTLLQRLQDLQILEATVTGNFRVLVPATRPSEPFSPQPARNAAMGLAAGLVIGIGIALLLEQFDTRVRSRGEAAAIFGMPVVGSIRKLSAKAVDEQPLIVLGSSHNAAAESIRKLRGNLEFANVDGDLRSLVITSSLQHEGKSLLVCNLALSLAATGVRVVLVDGDLRRPQVHAYLKLPNGKGISTVLTGRSDLSETVCSRAVGPRLTAVRKPGDVGAERDGDERLYVLTSGPRPPNAAELVASKSFAGIIEELKSSYDLVIVDAPSVLAVGDAAAIAACVDGVVFVVDMTRARRPLLEEAAAQVEQMPCRKVGLVLISAAPSHRYSHDHYSYIQDPIPPTVSARSLGQRGSTQA